MKRFLLFFVPLLSFYPMLAQKPGNSGNAAISNSVQRPKLVVGIVVDQMRWDYLYRFHPLFSATGGFKRLMEEGFSCDNTLILNICYLD